MHLVSFRQLAAQRSAVLTVVDLPTLKLVATLAWATIFLQVSPDGTVGFAMTCEGVQAGLVLVVVVATLVLRVVEVEELLALLVLTLVLAVVAALELTTLFGDTVVLEERVLVEVLEITVVMELVLEDPPEAEMDPFADPLPPDRSFAPVFKPLPVVPVPEPTP